MGVTVNLTKKRCVNNIFFAYTTEQQAEPLA